MTKLSVSNLSVANPEFFSQSSIKGTERSTLDEIDYDPSKSYADIVDARMYQTEIYKLIEK